MASERARIFVVEGDPGIVLLLARMLGEEYLIEAVADGGMALERAVAFHPDLILLDGSIPGSDGFDLCTHFKRHDALGKVPVIFVSGRIAPEEEARGFAAGAVDYIRKPLSAPIVRARVRTHVALAHHLRRADRELEATGRRLGEEAEARRRLREGRAAIATLLESALKPMSLVDQLESALSVIRQLPWLKMAGQGAIFLYNGRNELVLAAEHGVAAPIKERCHRVAMGHCLCGRAATAREVLFADRVDERHRFCFEEMGPYGHYVLPLADGERLLGVLTVYVAEGHRPGADERELMEQLAATLAGIVSRRLMEELIQVKQLELEEARAEVVRKLGVAAEYRDTETGMHVIRMSHYAGLIAERIGLPPEECELLRQAAPMHDVGKIGIPDEILLKPGKLTAEEFAAMKTHSAIGGEILSGDDPLLETARLIALSHHERWDGSGYPAGLKGEAIPLFGRICAVADVFDALTMERPYKKAWSVDDAARMLQEGAGSHFEPRLVAAFIEALPEAMRIKSLYRDGTIDPLERLMLPAAREEEGAWIRWDDAFSVGIDTIDQHHRFLLDLTNRVHQALSGHLGAVPIGRALRELERYTAIHFAEEERMMAEYGYPEMERHLALHDAFRAKVRQFWEELRRNPLILGVEMADYLRDWLLHHIQKTDKEIIHLIRLPAAADGER